MVIAMTVLSIAGSSQKDSVKRWRRWSTMTILALSICLAVGTGWLIYDKWSFHPVGEIAFECEWDGSIRQICIVNADGTSRRIITSLNQQAESPAWSPDGLSLAFIEMQAHTEQDADCPAIQETARHSEKWQSMVYRYDYLSEEKQLLWTAPRCSLIFHVIWSPDGNQLLINAVIDGDPGVFALELSQPVMEPKLVILQKYEDPYIRSAFSMNGEQIYYADYPSNSAGSRMFRINLDGTNREELGELCYDMAMAPNGLMAACSYGPAQLSIRNVADWSAKSISNWATLIFNASEPAWSPNGHYIVYRQRHLPRLLSDNGELWIMRADGSHPTKLTSGPNDRNPAWRPQP